MTRTPALALRASVAVLTALALAACTPAAPAETEAPGTPSAEPAPSTPVATAEPAPTESEATGPQMFASQDGAVRIALPEGWSVDDRSAMGPVSEMYNTGPRWLNDLVLLDSTGAQMVWYRETYGDDHVVCADREWELEVPIEPHGPGMSDVTPAPVVIVGQAGLATDFRWDAEPGAGGAAMGLQVQLSGDCAGYDESIWLGDRVAHVDVVADAPGAEQPETSIAFPDEQAAHDWLQGEEAAQLIEVLSSIEFTGAPLLDQAP